MLDDDLLVRTALDAAPREALAAARELARLPTDRLSPALAALAAALPSPSPPAQRRALLVCGVLGPRAAALMPDLLATLDSPRWAVREAALHALARIGPTNDAVRRRAADAALDRNAAVRDAAVELLAATPGELPDAVAAALDHRHPRVRCRALRAAARLAPAASAATLAAALVHSHYRVRRTAAELLGALGPPALPAAGRLARCRFDGHAAVARAALRALTRLSPHLPDSLEPLLAEQAEPAALLAALLDRLPELRGEAEATRAGRLERLHRPDPAAETRWLLGWLVERAILRG
jgi:HEAT repeat protein